MSGTMDMSTAKDPHEMTRKSVAHPGGPEPVETAGEETGERTWPLLMK